MRLSTEERRALGFIAGMVLLSVLGRWVDRPKPLDTDLETVNLDSLEAASRAMRPTRGGRIASSRAGTSVTKSPKARKVSPDSTKTVTSRSRHAADSARVLTARRAPASAPAPKSVFVPGSAITHIISTEEVGTGAIKTLNLNTATAAQLEQLPRVGPVLAQRIVAYRESVGRFENVDALVSVKGVGPAMMERLRPYLRVP